MVKNLQVFSNYKTINKVFIHKLINALRKELDFIVSSLSIDIISAAEIHQVNKKFLNHDYSTDILTFDYSGNNKKLNAEIMISYEDVKQNAKLYNVKVNDEIARLVIHGILHLTGFNDSKKKDKIIMKRKENQLLKKYNFALL